MANTSEERKPQLNIPAPQELKDELKNVARKTGQIAAHIAREAIWEKLAHIKNTHPAYQNSSDRIVSDKETIPN